MKKRQYKSMREIERVFFPSLYAERIKREQDAEKPAQEVHDER